MEAADIEDMFPCTALQEGLLALTAKKPGSYVQRTLFNLEPEIDIAQLRQAWDEVATAAPILRTRIVDLGEGQGLFQVVLRHRPLVWKQFESIERYRISERDEEREQRSMYLGVPLVAFGLIEDGATNQRYMAFTQHHATYDGWSLKFLFDAAEQAYTTRQAVVPGTVTPFQSFIHYLISRDTDEEAAFWTTQFSGLDTSPFPVVPAQHQPRIDQALDHTMGNICWPTNDVTPSSILRAAWATLLSWYTATPDTVFGAVVSGRQAPVADIDRVAGPTIATVPVRIVVDEDIPVAELLRRTQAQATDMIPFEQAGLQNISRLSEEARRACEFQTLLVVQAAETSDRDTVNIAGQRALFKSVNHDEESLLAELDAFSTYAITLTCDVNGPTVHLRVGFDSKVISTLEVQRLAHQLEHILRQFCLPEMATSGLKVGQLNATPAHDLAIIWQWNKTVPETTVSSVHHLFQQRVHDDPTAPAICAHDGNLTFGELDHLSNILARHLHHEAGVRAGVIVPLYFEKSLWVPVAILAVMKAGGACVTMDATLPVERLRGIVKQVAPVLMLNSAACEAVAPEVTDVPKLTIHNILMDKLERTEEEQALAGKPLRTLPTVDPSSPLYLVFTSGSTGKPKGAVVTHANYCSSARHHQGPLGVERSSRIYEFTSYAFDVAWSNMLHAFTSGACLCIPSEQDRITDITGSIRRLAADFVHITPTVANILDPPSLPTLKRMLFTGEALKRGDVARWRSRPDVLYYNTYGPAECTVTSAVAVVDPFDDQEPTIGQPHGVLAWVVRPDGKDLVAVGAPGELWIEGPTVGAGYLNNPEKTASAFVEDPEWLLRGGAGVPGRRGRLYRTGDIVRYNPDGSLFYFGRKDTQVKIRGQRVELGEVDYHVRQVLPPSVQQVVAEIITPDAIAASLLAVFFTAEEGEECTAMIHTLKEQLVRTVPPYMVPTAYIPVAELPMTASGKTDRRALRELGKAYTPPSMAELDEYRPVSDQELTQEEEALRRIWARLLNVEPTRIGPNHSFSRLGGDSIKTMSLAVALRREWKLQVPIPQLLASSSSQDDTLRGMAALVRSLQHRQDVLAPAAPDVESELAALTAQLRIPPQAHPEKGHRPTVFLTGATGFLGTQILWQVISSGRFCHAVLLVRSLGTHNGLSRVQRAAEQAGWWDDSFASFISVWEGDLSAPRLGLSDTQWASLCGCPSTSSNVPAVDVIIHNGAAVHWGTRYEHLRAANVGSTLQLLQAALHSKVLKKFVYVSGGLSACDWAKGKTSDDAATAATGYDQSKYISERLVATATLVDKEIQLRQEEQQECERHTGKSRFSVVKPGLIIGGAPSGAANPDDFLWRVVAAASRLQARPVEAATSWLAVADVSFVANIVLQHVRVDIGTHPDYVELDRGLPVEAFWAAVEEELEQPLRRVTWAEWIELARRDIADQGERHPLFPVQHFLGNLGAEDGEKTASDDESVELEIRQVSEAVRMNVKYLKKAGVVGAKAISWHQATAYLTMRSRKQVYQA
jgi:amino acid adenylation domain-containing protein/thioester reductase-like protein